jgi:hypothetical protein
MAAVTARWPMLRPPPVSTGAAATAVGVTRGEEGAASLRRFRLAALEFAASYAHVKLASATAAGVFGRSLALCAATRSVRCSAELCTQPLAICERHFDPRLPLGELPGEPCRGRGVLGGAGEVCSYCRSATRTAANMFGPTAAAMLQRTHPRRWWVPGDLVGSGGDPPTAS